MSIFLYKNLPIEVQTKKLLKDLRSKKQLSQSEFSKTFGVRQSVLSRAENKGFGINILKTIINNRGKDVNIYLVLEIED
jgi:predicted XRE-type DNA-binding protein